MKIGDEVYIHGYVDEIRQNVVIIRNDGGYFGTVAEEITNKSENPNTCGDAISRQAVLDEIDRRFDLAKPFKQLIESMPSVTPQQRTGRWIDDDHAMAIKALEQENILDKIRAEIAEFEEEVFHRTEDYSDYAAVRYCLEIIDKYKAESEDKE